MLRRISADLVPGRLRVHEQVHADLDARVSVDAAERDPVDLPLAQKQPPVRSVVSANCDAPPGRSVVLGRRQPLERFPP